MSPSLLSIPTPSKWWSTPNKLHFYGDSHANYIINFVDTESLSRSSDARQICERLQLSHNHTDMTSDIRKLVILEPLGSGHMSTHHLLAFTVTWASHKLRPLKVTSNGQIQAVSLLYGSNIEALEHWFNQKCHRSCYGQFLHRYDALSCSSGNYSGSLSVHHMNDYIFLAKQLSSASFSIFPFSTFSKVSSNWSDIALDSIHIQPDMFLPMTCQWKLPN